MMNSLGQHSISVILPVRNEAKAIGDVVARLRGVLGHDVEILVIDDGSTDESAKIAEQAGARVLRHPHAMGNGAAVKTAIRHAAGDWLVLMDGDGQHDPNDLPALLEALDRYDMVVGARSSVGQASPWRGAANAVYNAMASYVTQQRVQDLTSGFRAIRRRIAQSYLYLLPNTFSYPTTLTLACMRSGHSVAYVPITVRRRVGSSKIRVLSDGSRFLLIILKIATLVAPLRIFLPISLLCVVGGALNYLYTYLVMHRFTNMSMLLLLTGVLVFLLGLIAEGIADLRFQRTEEATVSSRESMNT